MGPARLADCTLEWWINDMVHRGAGTEVSLRIALAAVTAASRVAEPSGQVRAAQAAAQAWLEEDAGALLLCERARAALSEQSALDEACGHLLTAVIESADTSQEVRRGARCTTYLAVYGARLAFEASGQGAHDWERAYRRAMAEQDGPHVAQLQPWQRLLPLPASSTLTSKLIEAARKRTG